MRVTVHLNDNQEDAVKAVLDVDEADSRADAIRHLIDAARQRAEVIADLEEQLAEKDDRIDELEQKLEQRETDYTKRKITSRNLRVLERIMSPHIG